MARKDFDLTSMIRDGADELRGAVEKVLAERPLLVLGLALELGLLAGHWARGGKVSVLDLAKRALASSPQSMMAAIMPGTKSARRRAVATAARRKPKVRKTATRRKAAARRKTAGAAAT